MTRTLRPPRGINVFNAIAKPLPKEVIDRADELHRSFQGTDASYAR